MSMVEGEKSRAGNGGKKGFKMTLGQAATLV